MYGKTYTRPFIPLLIALIFGIIAGLYFPGHRISAYGMISVCFIFIFYRIISDYSKPHKFVKNIFFSPLLLFSALGYLSLQPYVAPRFPPNHIIRFADDNKWLITGIIDEKPIKDKDRVKFVLKLEKLGRNTPAAGMIRVSASENIPELSKGDRISFVSIIKSIKNINNPGGFDYQQYRAYQKIWVSASVTKGYPIILLEKNAEKRRLEDFRDNISKLIDETGPGDHIGVLKALIIGDKNEISESVRQDFNQAGIAHLLAISGLHVGIVASLSFFLFRLLFFRFKFLCWNGYVKKGAAILSCFPVILYGLISGISSSDSTQRAVITVVVFLSAFLMGKTKESMNTLAVAAMLILAVDPPSLFSVSFQLSFASVFSILYTLSLYSRMITEEKERIKIILSDFIDDQRKRDKALNEIFKEKNQTKEKSFSLLLVSLSATLGTLPFVMLYYNNVSLAGLFSNFIFIPLVGFVVIPSGLLSVLLYMVCSKLSSICMNVSAFVLANAIEAVTPTYFEIFVFYLSGWAVLKMISIPPDKSVKKNNRCLNKDFSVSEYLRDFRDITGFIYELHRKICSLSVIFKEWLKNIISLFIQTDHSHEKDESKRKFAKIVLTATIIIGICDIAYWIHYRFFHNDLRITIIDVGQGTSALVEFPGGDCFLIDGGGSPDDSDFDVGERIVMPFLLKKRIKTLDAVILSHPDSDHLNGLVHILKNLNVKEVWTNHDGTEEKGYQEFTEIINKKSIPHLKSGELPVKEINGTKIEILYPPADYMDKKETWRKKANNNSLVVKITFGSVSFLFPGDIESESEEELVNIAGEKLKSTILIAPHHGSKTSSTEKFIKAVSPEYVIISAGWKNSFNLPHPSVIKRYTEEGYRIFRTDENGAIHITSDGKFLNIKPYKEQQIVGWGE